MNGYEARVIRERIGWSKEIMAQVLGVHPGAVRIMEKQHIIVPDEDAQTILEVFREWCELVNGDKVQPAPVDTFCCPKHYYINEAARTEQFKRALHERSRAKRRKVENGLAGIDDGRGTGSDECNDIQN